MNGIEPAVILAVTLVILWIALVAAELLNRGGSRD